MKMSSQRIIDCYKSPRGLSIQTGGGNVTISKSQIDLVNSSGDSCSSEVESVPPRLSSVAAPVSSVAEGVLLPIMILFPWLILFVTHANKCYRILHCIKSE